MKTTLLILCLLGAMLWSPPALAVDAPAGSPSGLEQPAPVGAKSVALPEASTESASLDAAAAPLPASEGPQGIPLKTITRGAALPLASNGGGFRLTLSLAAVLMLVMGFLKFGLPGLMARYPQFFPAAEPSRGALARRHSKPSMLSPTGPDKLLEMLHSLPLGGGQALHLVQVRDRQLVIATSPGSVTLLTQFADADEASLGETPAEILQALSEQAPKDFTQAYVEPSSPPGNSRHATPPGNEFRPAASQPGPAAQAVLSRMASKVSSHPPRPWVEHQTVEEVIVLDDYEDEYPA